MEIEYLTHEQLLGFDNYKYSSLDTSPLSIYVMHPFWNKVVEYCPKWIAPNLLTFSGFLLTLLNYLLFAWYDYHFYASDDARPEYPPAPRWVFALAAFNLFLAYTLDGIDGKQARRTQTSGPLGELFDHGLDSYSSVLIPLSMFSNFGCGEQSLSTVRLYYVMWNVFFNFYLPHFEKYNTGVLFLPWGYDFSMWGSVLVFFMTAIGGHEAWKFVLPGGITAGMLFEFILYISAFVSNLPVVFWNIYKSYKNRTGKMLSLSEAIRPVIPIAICITLGSLWVHKSPSSIITVDPRALYFTIGTIFSNICCRLIVAQMSNSRSDWFNWLLVPLAAAVGLSLTFGNLSFELTLLYLVCSIAVIAHVHYGTCIVRQMCRHFRIDCFRIKSHED